MDQNSSHKNKSFIKRLSYALKGLQSIWKQEASFRFQSFCALLLLIFCLLVRPPAVWCAIFTLATVLVLALEIINTAVEAMLDKLHPEFDPKIGFVKDCLAGAVLIASIGAVITFLIFLFTGSPLFISQLLSIRPRLLH